MTRPDALNLANELDEAWHKQARSFEREAVTRFWGLLTLPARALDPDLPRELLRAATVIRNARFHGTAVQEMFFADQQFTEVDALFLGVGSPLGHPRGEDAWVVEVERKTGHQQGDYYRAIHRAKRFADLLEQAFGLRARPVVIYEDDGGKLTYKTFEGDVLLITMSTLRERTRGLSFDSPADIPGAACDRTLVKLALLRQLVRHDPNVPGRFADPLTLARTAEIDGWPIRLPVMGHQDASALPPTVAEWKAMQGEDDDHVKKRVAGYLQELREHGLLDRIKPEPRLSYAGGQVVLRANRAESEDTA